MPHWAGADRLIGGRRTGVALIPAGGRDLAALERQHPGAAEAELEEQRVVGEFLDVRIAQYEPGVVGSGGQQIAHSEVARLDTVGPGHPFRREQGAVAGQQHHLVDRDDLGAWCAVTTTAQYQPR